MRAPLMGFRKSLVRSVIALQILANGVGLSQQPLEDVNTRAAHRGGDEGRDRRDDREDENERPESTFTSPEVAAPISCRGTRRELRFASEPIRPPEGGRSDPFAVRQLAGVHRSGRLRSVKRGAASLCDARAEACSVASCSAVRHLLRRRPRATPRPLSRCDLRRWRRRSGALIAGRGCSQCSRRHRSGDRGSRPRGAACSAGSAEAAPPSRAAGCLAPSSRAAEASC